MTHNGWHAIKPNTANRWLSNNNYLYLISILSINDVSFKVKLFDVSDFPPSLTQGHFIVGGHARIETYTWQS